ncbi:cell wall elongation regulator TseB-like domain-containing protein [Cohnella nanjingensis]|uniref:DUF5590 domain-containing protein n=1 Tax=Cohnella nanjingensis TaxID=1387779 RepID=A0A7X0VHE8_9BACL|nr:DUF5590 domain-containing protein [Cohnella nanjingensis]MBB6674092.1 DUF5590 domain-containing protein [Cohnella nanjingensis]
MSLSRTKQRRTPFLSPVRWVLLVASFLLFVAVCLAIYVRNADSAYRNASHAAMATAKREAGLTSIDEVDKHVWEEIVWVVHGKDQAGVSWFVWERESGGVVKEQASAGVGRKEIENRFETGHPGKPIVRLLPGWFANQPAWELRYVDDAELEREAIDFYAFKDGALLGTYDLPGK